MKYKDYKIKLADRYCRKCLVDNFGIKLGRKDCMYSFYPRECSGCGEVKNIVVDIRRLSRYKLIRCKM